MARQPKSAGKLISSRNTQSVLVPRGTPADRPLLLCPILGTPVTIEEHPQKFKYRIIGGYDTRRLYQDLDQLVMDYARRYGMADPRTVDQLLEPDVLRCPWYNTPVHIQRLENCGLFRLVDGFDTGGFYEYREDLEYEYSTREGVTPAFPKRVKITVVGERVKTSDPTEGVVTAPTDLVQERADKILWEAERAQS